MEPQKLQEGYLMFQGMHYVYEVYKEKSFSKAAQNLYISQPSLSATIKKTETRIGTPIFDRSTTPIRLTECGQEYIKCVEKILDVQNEFENYLNDMQELKTGQISIGASNLFASFILPPYISRFTQRYPKVKVNLVEANTPLLLESLSDGTLDLIIDNSSYDEELYNRYPLCSDHLLLAVPKAYLPEQIPSESILTCSDIVEQKHLEPTVPSVPLYMFENAPFLFLRSGNDTRRRAELICHHQHYEPNIILKLDQQVTAYHLACYGMGIAFVSDTLIQKALPNPNIVFFRFDDPEASRIISFYCKKHKYVTKAMKEFLKITSDM